MNNPSDLFLDLVIDSGTPVADCQFCKRVHFDVTGEYMEEGELASLEAKHKYAPDKYQPHQGTVHYGHINGMQVVAGCACGKLAQYEEFIWSHRLLIADYLIARAESARSSAEDEMRRIAPLNPQSPAA